MVIDGPDLKCVMPRCPKAEEYAPFLAAAAAEFEITTVTRLAAFLGQLSWESGELRYFEEMSDGSAYEGRASLGNIRPGDGARFKGRGPIQLTGRNNYRAAGVALGLDLENHPELAATPAVGFRIAGWYWRSHNLNARADARDFVGITKAINGAATLEAPSYLNRRLEYYHRALEVLGCKSRLI